MWAFFPSLQGRASGCSIPVLFRQVKFFGLLWIWHICTYLVVILSSAYSVSYTNWRTYMLGGVFHGNAKPEEADGEESDLLNILPEIEKNLPNYPAVDATWWWVMYSFMMSQTHLFIDKCISINKKKIHSYKLCHGSYQLYKWGIPYRLMIQLAMQKKSTCISTLHVLSTNLCSELLLFWGFHDNSQLPSSINVSHFSSVFPSFFSYLMYYERACACKVA